MDRKQFKLGGGKAPRSHLKNAGFIALIILFALVFYSAIKQPSQLSTVPFSQVISQANKGQIKEITVNGDELTITPQGQSAPTEKSYKEPGSSIYEQGLQQGKVQLNNKPSSSSNSFWGQLIISVLPVAIIAFLIILMFK